MAMTDEEYREKLILETMERDGKTREEAEQIVDDLS